MILRSFSTSISTTAKLCFLYIASEEDYVSALARGKLQLFCVMWSLTLVTFILYDMLKRVCMLLAYLP